MGSNKNRSLSLTFKNTVSVHENDKGKKYTADF